MFKNLQSALDVLEQRRNQKLGIEGLKRALQAYGNPQQSLVSIHIGGTNGKGSTTDFTRAILEAAGNTVGTFTSPHLIEHNDRIRINNDPIADTVFLKYINETQPIWDQFGLSMFEIDMLISLLYFKEQEVDVCIYEVGLGGRLDATNVIIPEISAITHVDYDHMEILGDTLEKIAGEKAGIVKHGVPLYTMETHSEALRVFEGVCAQKGAPFHALKIPEYAVDGNEIHFESQGVSISLTNQAVYQVENATLAMAIAHAFDVSISVNIMKYAVENTHWAGRFEKVSEGVFVDGAHNINGVQRLVESLVLVPKPWVIVFAALKDKDHHAMVSLLENAADTCVVTEFDFYRAARAHDLAQGHQVTIMTPHEAALDYGLAQKNSGTLIVTGSLYFISEARAYLLQKEKGSID